MCSSNLRGSNLQAELDTLEKRWLRRLEMQQREAARKAAASSAAGLGRPSTSFDTTGSNASTSKQDGVVQTASWLERAKSALKEPAADTTGSTEPSNEILETQMQEVERLINEGPIIQQTSAGIPTLLEQQQQQGPPRETPSPTGLDTEPADKRLRTAEGAEALVGFIRSVRASAAAGQNL